MRSSSADLMPEFRSKVGVIYTIMNMIKSNNEQIDELKNQEIKTTSSETEKSKAAIEAAASIPTQFWLG